MKFLFFVIPFLSISSAWSQECLNYISEDIDKYNGKIRYTLRIDDCPITYVKTISTTKDTTYFVRLKSFSPTFEVSKKGVQIVLEDGTKINKPEIKVDCKSGEGANFEYTSMVILDKNDIKLLSKSRMLGFRLYIFDGVYDTVISKKMLEFFNCLILK